MFQIDVSNNGELLLYLPTGRPVEITASVDGINFVKKIILDHRRQIRNQPGYIGSFPTQAAIDKFLAEKKKKLAAEKAAETKSKAKKLDIDWDKLEINL